MTIQKGALAVKRTTHQFAFVLEVISPAQIRVETNDGSQNAIEPDLRIIKEQTGCVCLNQAMNKYGENILANLILRLDRVERKVPPDPEE